MADDPKPKAGFLGGRKPASNPEPASVAPPAAAPVPASVASSSFLKRNAPAASPSPEPTPASAPLPATAAPTQQAQEPVNAAIAMGKSSAGIPTASVSALFKKKGGYDRPRAEQMLQRGVEHYDRAENDEALAAYQECIKADPTFAAGHNSLGMVLIDMERYEEALAALHEGVRLDPNYAEAYNSIGFVMRRMQRQIEAASAYNRYLELEPGAEEAPRIRSWIDGLLKENNLQVVPPFSPPGKSAPAPAPEAPKIKKMAAWEVAAGDTATAAPVSVTGEILEAPPPPPPSPASVIIEAPVIAPPVAARPEPSIPQPEVKPVAAAAPKPPLPAKKPPVQAAQPAGGAIGLVERGMDQFSQGNLDAAAGLFQQAIELEPGNVEGHLGLGKVFVRQEKLQEGLACIDKAISFDPQEPAAYYVRGFTLRAMEHNIEAAESYETFLKLMPNALDEKKIREWVRQTKGASASGPIDSENYNFSPADDEEVITECDKNYKIALSVFQEGNDENALNGCVKILTDDPAHFRTRVLLGRIYLRQKSYDNAIEQLEGALVTTPDYPEALYYLGHAADKRGIREKASANFKRYLEVAPSGPRAEKLREWIAANGTVEDGGANQVACELCLRFFPESEIEQHDGKATCHNCMAVMGHQPLLTQVMTSSELPQKPASASQAAAAVKMIKPRSSLALVGALGGVAAVLGALYFFGYLNPVLRMVGLAKAKKRPHIVIAMDPDAPDWVFDPKKVVITNEAATEATPFARWTYTPDIQGIKDLDEHAQGWKLDLQLKSGPKGMQRENKSLWWTPEYVDFDALKKGDLYPVEFEVKGTSVNPDGTVKEWFTLSRSFTVHCQFGYAPGEEVNLGELPAGPVSIAAGDFNGDQRADLLICSGRFRQGELRLHIQNRDKQFPETPVLLAKGSRFSALYTGDLDGNRSDDILAADWQHGRLKLFYQDAQQPVEGPSVAVGAGPVAIGVLKTEGARPQIGTLLGAGNALAILSLSPDRKFSDVVTVPLPPGGSHGFVFPWNSADAGPGFLAVLPLAEQPLQFVAFNKGQWTKEAIASPVDDGLITGAAVLTGLGTGSVPTSKLALIITAVNGASSRLQLYEEKAAKFTAVGESKNLSSPGVGLLNFDFNRDGMDDLVVVMQDECELFFDQGTTLVPGPEYNSTIRLSGQAAALTQKDRPPDLILMRENRKAFILRAVVNVAPVASPPAAEKVEKSGKPSDADANSAKKTQDPKTSTPDPARK